MSWLLRLAGIVVSLIGLIGINLWIADGPIDTSPLAEIRQAGEESVAPVDTGNALDLGQLNLTQATSRPLFAKDRKPWVPPPPPPPKPQKQVVAKPKPVARPVPPPNVRLIGVSISQGPARALLTGDGNPDPVWVVMGDAVDGWTVSEITPRIVKMRLEDKVVALDLYPDSPPDR